jgi:hypothetical protein
VLVLFLVRVRLSLVMDDGASHRVKDLAFVWEWAVLEAAVGVCHAEVV